MATIDTVKEYLASVGVPTGKYSDAVLNSAIATELAAQYRKTGGTGAGSPELLEALCRRVQVNLAKRRVPLGVVESVGDMEGATAVFVPRQDSEIRRLEAPFRRVNFR